MARAAGGIPAKARAALVADLEDVLHTYEKPYDSPRPAVCVDDGGKQLIGEVREPLPVRPGSPAEEYFRFRAVFEPLEIRHDRWPGEADPGVYPKYSYGAAYRPVAFGMVRVAEDRPEARTHFYTGGDERNVVKDRDPVASGLPTALGGVFRIEPVALPVA
ncbi:hypothetical protein J0H58_19950 [bacterium]|nr:hypothetical protein [bacterium]